MPSSPSTSLRFEIQAAGENLNTWGDTKLNNALNMLEAGGHGYTEHALTASKSLTYTNYTLTDGTDFAHKFTSASDGSYTITLGGYERAYWITNDSGFSQTIACSGGGSSITVADGESLPIYCNGSDVIRPNIKTVTGDLTVSGNLVVSTAPTQNAHATNKQYVDGLAFAAADLPGQSAATNLGSITSDGTNASWEQDIQPEVITASETAVARRQPYMCNTSGGAFTLTLPASPSSGDFVQVMTNGSASLNNLTIGRNSETINGAAADAVIRINNARILFVYNGTGWDMLGAQGGILRVTSNTTAVANTGLVYYCDTSGGAFTLTLPASPSAQDIVRVRCSGDVSATNLTIARNSSTIEGEAADLTVDTNYFEADFAYLNSDWRI